MNLKQIATGIVSGYASKAIQLAASLLIVPFLLDPQALGVEDYGRAFAILAITSLIGIATVGIHLAAERGIAQAIGRASAEDSLGVPELLGSGTKVLLLINLVFISPLVLFDTSALEWIGIPPETRYRGAILAAAAISLFENSLYLFRAPLIARGDIAYVNLVGMLEITGRTAAVFVIFASGWGTITTFLGLQAAFTLARQVAFLARLQRSDTKGLLRAPISRSIATLRYAGPVSLAEGAVILVRSVPVLIASRFLGATEAGYVALVVNTLQGYFLQVFYAVVQPIAVPIASRFMLGQISPERRKWFLDVESAYCLGVAIVFGQLIQWTPVLIHLWLGTDFAVIALPTQIMLAGTGVQTAAIIRRSVLLGQGDLPAAVPTLVWTALASIMLAALGVAVFHSWMSAIVSSSGYLIASSSLGIDRIFARRFDRSGESGAIRRLMSFTLIFTTAYWVGERMAPELSLAHLAWAIAGLTITTAIAFSTILSIRRAMRLAEQLYRSRSTNLFR